MNFVIAAKACEKDLLAMNNNVCTKASIFVGFVMLISAGSIISPFSNINGSFNISITSSGLILLRIFNNKVFDKN